MSDRVFWYCPNPACRFHTHGTTVAAGLPVWCACGTKSFGSVEPLPPGVLKKGTNYAKARYAWEVAGRPLRTDEETAALRVICTACVPYYDAATGRCTHKKCGCKVSGPGWLGDKLKWATEHCPVGKW